MYYKDLRDFLQRLEERGELRRITQEIDPHLEMTEICDRTLRAGGPALLFENPRGHTIPVLGNLFGTTVARRVRYGRGVDRCAARDRPTAGHAEGAGSPAGHEGCLAEAAPVQKSAGHGAEGGQARSLPGACHRGGCGRSGQPADPDLLAGGCRPAHHLGAGGHQGTVQAAPEPGHLPPAGHRPQQGHHALAGPAGRRAGFPRLVRGTSGRTVSGGRGAGRRSGHHSGRRDAGARHPVRIRLCRSVARRQDRTGDLPDSDLQVPASAEIILEGSITPGEDAEEGPFGDHTGYYNEVERFPVFTISASPTATTRFTTAPIPAGRRTSRPSWARH